MMKKKFCEFCGRELLGDESEGAIIVEGKIITCCLKMKKKLKLNKVE